MSPFTPDGEIGVKDFTSHIDVTDPRRDGNERVDQPGLILGLFSRCGGLNGIRGRQSAYPDVIIYMKNDSS